jgi:hypothetical protein
VFNTHPNLRCPRNGKWTSRKAPLSPSSHWASEKAAGKAVKVVPPARIPANKAVVRKHGHNAHALSGKTVRVFSGSY